MWHSEHWRITQRQIESLLCWLMFREIHAWVNNMCQSDMMAQICPPNTQGAEARGSHIQWWHHEILFQREKEVDAVGTAHTCWEWPEKMQTVSFPIFNTITLAWWHKMLMLAYLRWGRSLEARGHLWLHMEFKAIFITLNSLKAWSTTKASFGSRELWAKSPHGVFYFVAVKGISG